MERETPCATLWTEDILNNNLARLLSLVGAALLCVPACVLDNTDDGFLAGDPVDINEPEASPEGEPEATPEGEPEGEPEAEPEPEPEAPIFRFVLVEDLAENLTGDFPGADIDAISVVKANGEELFAQSFEEDTNINCEGNLACDANGLLGAPDAVDPATGTCFGGGAPDGLTFTALNAGFVVVQFSSVADGDVTIENGDSIHVYEVGAAECGRFDDDAFLVSIAVSDAINGDFKEMGEGGRGSNIVPVTGL